MPVEVFVRLAVEGDAEAIAQIHVKAWQQAYRHLAQPALLDALQPADRVERWREIILAPVEDAWIAELDGMPVAWATASDRDAAKHPRARELNGMYALERAYGTGVGQLLLDAAIGRAQAFLWVAADNPRAHAFYRRNGFAVDGAVEVYELLGSPIPVVRMVRSRALRSTRSAWR